MKTKTGICTSLKSYFYYRFHSPLNTKVGIAELYLYMGFGADLLKNCQNWNLHTSKIGKLLPASLTQASIRYDHISELHAKFGENSKEL